MRLKLTYEATNSAPADVLLTADPDVKISHLARWLAVRQGVNPDGSLSIGVRRTGGTSALLPDTFVADSLLRSGDVVSLIEAPTSAPPSATVVTIRVVAGPDMGYQTQLPAGHVEIGRDPSCGIRLTDPMVSQRHARILVSDRIEVVDHGSSNGTIVAGDFVTRAVLESGSEIVVGATTLLVHVEGGGWSASRSGAEPYNRSPWLDPHYKGVKLKAPEPPQPERPQSFPYLMLAAPVILAIVLYFITRSVASLAFLALSPVMMLGSVYQGRRTQKQDWAAAVEEFHASMADLVQQMQRAMEREQAGRQHEHPSTQETINAGLTRHPMLWCRRPDQPSFLDVRLGLGTIASRNEIETPSTRNTTPELWQELTDVTERFATVERVPVVGALTETGALGVAGADPARIDTARGLVAQFAALHSPSELTIAAIVPSLAKPDWEWLKWLPHSDSEYSPVAADQLASSGPAATTLMAALADLIDERSPDKVSKLPAILVIIDEGAPFERSNLVDLAERGPEAGIYTLWLGEDRTHLPAVCRAFLEVDSTTMTTGAGTVIDGSYVTPVEVGFLNAPAAMEFARSLAPVVDAGAVLDESASLPRTVSFASEHGIELLDDPGAVIDRWRQSGSISSEAVVDRRGERSLRGFVGISASGPLMLDLRSHGPHALVGGTTGSGKSEFLQSWLLGMAVGHSPERINFLLVDYKGGSAFGECANLPHSVGLVTDLNTRLVRRALTSLRAEVTRREHLLQEWRAKDLIDLESKERDGAPVVPSLIIVVDEFAALVSEIPEFVDGMIDIAQRGRSLGLHLVLATQRPSGVIKDNLRANTNLRIALRVADESDSDDVVGSKIAASFDPDTPGRGVAKLGPGKLVPFQAGYVGGWSTGEPPEPTIQIADLPFGSGAPWHSPPAVERGARDLGPKDLQRLCASITGAFTRAQMADPLRPWLPELEDSYELSLLHTARFDNELVFGVGDDPQRQSQMSVAFEPDRDGNLLVVGASGSGRTTFLRTITVAAGIADKGGPCVVYGIDASGRGLEMLEALPHVGSIIAGDDDERIKRLLRELRYTIDQRLGAFAAVKAGTLVEYRQLANRPDEQRVLVVIDGLQNLIAAYDDVPGQLTLDRIESIIQDGRSVGVHVVVSIDRVASIRPAVLSGFPARLALRINDEMDLMSADLAKDAFDESTPPGRGYFKGQEVQVAILAGDETSIAAQGEAINRFARSMEKRGRERAPQIQRLPTLVRLADLPRRGDGFVPFGISDETMEPVAIKAEGLIAVTGPIGSGSTTALNTLVQSIMRESPDVQAAYLGVRRSGISPSVTWSRSAVGQGVAALADELQDELDAGTAREQIVVVESLGELTSDAEYELQRLFKTARSVGVCVLIEGELSVLSQSYGIAKDALASRQAIVLQPDAADLESISGFPSGRLNPASFPPGRGFLCLPTGYQLIQVGVV